MRRRKRAIDAIQADSSRFNACSKAARRRFASGVRAAPPMHAPGTLHDACDTRVVHPYRACPSIRLP
ncbi:hypothetical protein DB771_16235 [Burkholderia sp. AU29985]|nr:hypothetical protein XM57_00750 [Burkholderia cepacia]AYZ95941.1 hypothetical protein EGY28_12460 [Burkholderia dolosa]ETP61345.1 hypothetical protein BDSB_26760 [Burkholderia dolosa PC543]PRE54341.1 hypothetical protein C6P87_05680 [Burkholderia sp. AU12872]PUA75891.1 hypothetical protein DB771_16235 [Burkholderia sp. AU29985]